METATLTSPPRSVIVQPIQKSLSLPSYARAGGEGIDHKLIYAALEQREKVRRKSRIFKEKEKSGTARQNYFCLPLPSGNKCKETSLSSDTSCSSLEFQKPKICTSPPKAAEFPRKELNGSKENDASMPSLDCNAKLDVNNNSDEGNYVPESTKKERLVRGDTSRSTIGSSDSMERTEKSSKSSNDSLSRKERLVAIKARVEAERERKLCDSSSEEEETILRITRHNSDGVIHRTVREVKSKSSRTEKRFRRRVPEESASRRTARKQHRSLYLPSSTDLDSWKPPIIRSGSSFCLQKDLDDITKDFLDIESKSKQIHSITKDQYFSDICSGSYRSRFVKPIVDEIEAKERKQRLIRDSLTNSVRNRKNVASPNEMLFDTSSFSNLASPEVNQQKFLYENSQERDRNCVSPIFRAPTPPPRSPKSIEFVNKVILQHQNTPTANFYNEACSLERKRTVHRPNASILGNATQSLDVAKRDLLNSRRKTCNNFEETTTEKSKTPGHLHQSKLLPHHFPPRSPDLSQRLSGSTRKVKLSDIPSSKALITTEVAGKRWEKLELDSEKLFNSLESKSRLYEPDWNKWRMFLKSKEPACSCAPTASHECKCGRGSPQVNSVETTGQEGFNRKSASSPKLLRDRLKHSCNLRASSPETRRKIIAKLQQQEEEIKPDFCFTNSKDANDNLNTAMEELECAYRSLRMSNENLADNTKPDSLMNGVYSSRNGGDGSTICTNGFDSNIGNKTSTYTDNDFFKSGSKPTKPEPSIKDALCIEELFGDLTQQLDLEQKLLQETRCKKLPTIPAEQRKITETSESSPIPGLNDIEKNCFSVAENIATHESLEVSAITNIKQRMLAKKKHKAVRSLSENIASIMNSENFAATRKAVRENSLSCENRNTSLINVSDKPVHPVCRKTSECLQENLDVSSPRTENLPGELIKHSDPEEIWHVRVSMDPGSTPEAPPLPCEDSTAYSRLHSALRRQNENIVQKDALDALQSLKQHSSATRDRAAVRLSENELEKLLTTLLRDVSNTPIPDKKIPSLPPKSMAEDDPKGLSDYVKKRYFPQNMEPGISSQSRTTNEKQLAELLAEASGVPGNGTLDNNSNQNNNDSMGVHYPSFIPARERHFGPSYRVSNENRSMASHRNSACVENLCYPRTSWLSSRGSGRRHSIGLDDLSTYSGRRNYNEEKRPPTCNHPPISHCSSDTTANSPCAVDPSKVICQSEHVKSENQNYPRNVEFAVRSSCNGSSRTHSPVNFNPAQTNEKLKDKSFMRKSSLNRLEFVGQVCHATAHTSSQSQVPSSQQSSSEANSDQERTRYLASISSSLAKRKSTLSHHVEKGSCGGLIRQDALPEVADTGVKKGGLFSKYREGSLKFRNRKSPKALAAHFKKKSYSAGEQDSLTDFGGNAFQNKVCFSAQEIHAQESLQNQPRQEINPLSFDKNSPKPITQQSDCRTQNSQNVSQLSNKGLQNEASVVLTCDNSSHISGEDQLPKVDDTICCAMEERVSHSTHSHEKDDLGYKGESCTERLKMDCNLLSSRSPAMSSPVGCFPIGYPIAEDFSPSENNEVSAPSSLNTAGNQQGVVDAAEEPPLDIPTEGVESLNIKSSTPVESDKESVKQPSSILRKKYSEERREIHGILKNAEDKLASRLLPSILKHRESSEEKDNWSQSDLHSILKKSTSEDESSNNSPDIRPILKNTSTDDESSGLSSKPKPILKKRTSFSEECSYACFHSGELKPILKKKSIIDTCEEQPKPILKTRRKSEEAAGTMLEFAIGARPRAYSADRGVKMVTEKRANDDDLS